MRSIITVSAAGRGEVTITIDLKAGQYSTAGRFELLDADSKQLLAHNKNAATTTGAELQREAESLVQKLVLDSNTGDYKIRLDGAVNFGNTGQSAKGEGSNNPEHNNNSPWR